MFLSLISMALLTIPVVHSRGNPYCGKTNADFPIGVVPTCPEGYLMNVDCENTCKSTYKAQMIANYNIACSSYDTAYDGLLDDLDLYATAFAGCLANGTDPATCRTDYRDSCESSIETFETRKLAIASILNVANTTTYNDFFFCVFGCCEPE